MLTCTAGCATAGEGEATGMLGTGWPVMMLLLLHSLITLRCTLGVCSLSHQIFPWPPSAPAAKSLQAFQSKVHFVCLFMQLGRGVINSHIPPTCTRGFRIKRRGRPFKSHASYLKSLMRRAQAQGDAGFSGKAETFSVLNFNVKVILCSHFSPFFCLYLTTWDRMIQTASRFQMLSRL